MLILPSVSSFARLSRAKLRSDAAHSSAILAGGFDALADEGINVQMISQGASKVNISMIVDEEEADETVRILHKAYFS